MAFELRSLWTLEGTVGRRTYAATGFGLMLLKLALDQGIARVVFDRHWGPSNYFFFDTRTASSSAQPSFSLPLTLVLLALAVPFLWIGLALTLRRLRDAGLPQWLVGLFFLPILNLIFFAFLCLVPGRALAPRAEPAEPEGASYFASAAISVVVTVPLGLGLIALSTFVFETYGWGLFVGVPFWLGLLAAMIHGRRRRGSAAEAISVALLAVVLLAVALLLVAIEGLLCILMAAPIGLVIAMIGGLFGWIVQRQARRRRAEAAPAMLALLALPVTVGGEALIGHPAPLLEATTRMEVDAPPGVVWRRVIDFPDITDEPELLFRAGIAYPMRARIDGRGPGAIRYCEFSTGSFVEPIEVWDEPRLLRFSVTSNPAPMRELAPFGDPDPPHLDGFFVSDHGQFLLEPTPSGGTRIVATTWYRHHMWPAAYWTLWSDQIVNRIHLRVLRHIERLAEADARAMPSAP